MMEKSLSSTGKFIKGLDLSNFPVKNPTPVAPQKQTKFTTTVIRRVFTNTPPLPPVNPAKPNDPLVYDDSLPPGMSV